MSSCRQQVFLLVRFCICIPAFQGIWIYVYEHEDDSVVSRDDHELFCIDELQETSRNFQDIRRHTFTDDSSIPSSFIKEITNRTKFLVNALKVIGCGIYRLFYWYSPKSGQRSFHGSKRQNLIIWSRISLSKKSLILAIVNIDFDISQSVDINADVPNNFIHLNLITHKTRLLEAFDSWNSNRRFIWIFIK